MEIKKYFQLNYNEIQHIKVYGVQLNSYCLESNF